MGKCFLCNGTGEIQHHPTAGEVAILAQAEAAKEDYLRLKRLIVIYRRALYLAEIAPEGNERLPDEVIDAIQHDINCAKEYPDENPEIWARIEA